MVRVPSAFVRKRFGDGTVPLTKSIMEYAFKIEES